MPVIKTNLREIKAVRNDIKGKVKLGQLKSDILIKDIVEIPQATQGDNSAVVFTYEFKTSYNLAEPKGKKLGTIDIVGEIIYVGTNKVITDLVKEWKKDKKIRKEVLQPILNVAFEEAQVEALYQSKKVLLPPPIPLPKLRPKSPPQNAG